MRGRCFTVQFGRDGAAVESGVKGTGEIGKNRVFLYLRQNSTFYRLSRYKLLKLYTRFAKFIE